MMPSSELIKILRTGAQGLDHSVRFLILDACDRLERQIRDNELLMQKIVELRSSNKWISVTERLPEKDGHYICNYHFGEYPKMTFTQVLDYYATDIVPHFQHTLGDGSMKVTHWMPLPEPPKGE